MRGGAAAMCPNRSWVSGPSCCPASTLSTTTAPIQPSRRWRPQCCRVVDGGGGPAGAAARALLAVWFGLRQCDSSRRRGGGVGVFNDADGISNTCSFGRVAHTGVERLSEGARCTDPCRARARGRGRLAETPMSLCCGRTWSAGARRRFPGTPHQAGPATRSPQSRAGRQDVRLPQEPRLPALPRDPLHHPRQH